eukprot:5037394-Prymnesium_polylepis.1
MSLDWRRTVYQQPAVRLPSALFCPHDTPKGYRWKWLEKVDAVPAMTELAVGDADADVVAAALCGGDEFETPLQCITGLLSIGVAGAVGGYLDLPEGFALEPELRAVVGSLIPTSHGDWSVKQVPLRKSKARPCLWWWRVWSCWRKQSGMNGP